jgi:outer membrane protein OmpA-like peptidoglycan-associated protein
VSRFELDNLASALKENVTMIIEVAGHTDNVGDAASNLALSQARANSVVTYLVEQGVARERLSAKGYGQNNPLVANDTEENRTKNRRTEFKILSK